MYLLHEHECVKCNMVTKNMHNKLIMLHLKLNLWLKVIEKTELELLYKKK